MSQQLDCPVCVSAAPWVLLERANVPVQQNLTIRDQRRAVDTPRGDLHIAVCPDCGFVYNRAFDLAKLHYDETYDNTQTCSPAFDGYLTQLADYLVQEKNVRN